MSGPTTKVGGAGSPLKTTAPLSAPGWTPAGNYGVAPGAGGGVKIGGDAVLPVGGKNVPVGLSGELAKDAIIGGVVGCATGTVLGCAIGFGTPIALALLTSAPGGVRQNPDTKQWERADSAACTIGPCYGYKSQLNEPGDPFRSKTAACQNMWDQLSGQYTGGYWYSSVFVGYVDEGGEHGVCRVHLLRGESEGGFADVALNQFSLPPQSATWYPATPQDLRDALIAGGPPPPGIVPELADTGVDWNKIWPGYPAPAGSFGNPNVSGPSSITGPKETTTNPDGSTTTRQSSTPLTYSGNSVTAGPTTTTTTTTNSDGTPRSTTTSVTEHGTEGDAPKEDIPVQCDKYPDSLGCAELDTPGGIVPKETKNITFAPEDLFGTGSCPADVTASFQSIGGTSAKIVNWSGFCAQALPLRALVMALAAIMAFFIVMPGGRVE